MIGGENSACEDVDYFCAFRNEDDRGVESCTAGMSLRRGHSLLRVTHLASSPVSISLFIEPFYAIHSHNHIVLENGYGLIDCLTMEGNAGLLMLYRPVCYLICQRAV